MFVNMCDKVVHCASPTNQCVCVGGGDRYFSAWYENDGDMGYIQNEFCNGGSLEDANKRNREQMGGRVFEEIDVRQQLFHIAQALKFMHAMGGYSQYYHTQSPVDNNNIIVIYTRER